MPTRRRVLTILAAALALPAHAAAPPLREWRGRALGSAARIVLAGADAGQARRLFARIEGALARIEAQFSLHADSALVRLNRDGRLPHPGPHVHALFALAGRVHAATAGAFDPTVQPLWQAIATGGDIAAARRLIGWERVRIAPDAVTLPPGMALTFNGIAQGEAADRIAALLRSEGFGNVLIDTGEIATLGRHPDGRAWQAGIAFPGGAEIAWASLSDRALAVSAPGGTRIGARRTEHILDPSGARPRWRLAAVSAGQAALADALSTAFCLMDRRAIETALAQFPDAALEALI